MITFNRPKQLQVKAVETMVNKARHRLRYIWRFGKKHVFFFIIAEICILVSYAVSVLLPMNLTRLTDRVLYGEEYGLLRTVIRDYCLLLEFSLITPSIKLILNI